MAAEAVVQTAAGVFLRREVGAPSLVFSPFTGLTFAIPEGDTTAVVQWLETGSRPPTEAYRLALGPGWAATASEARFPTPHFLPDASAFLEPICSAYPILINWLITGNCLLACPYCYAEDLMGGAFSEPTRADIARIAATILSYRPLAVVLTGGDPLVSPHLSECIAMLSGRTGLILDTAGISLSRNRCRELKRSRVLVRVSLDSERPATAAILRPTCKTAARLHRHGSAEAALDAICFCLDEGLGVSVQTVVTRHNQSDLLAMGDKLFRLGVQSWRIFWVVGSKLRLREATELRGSPRTQVRFRDRIAKDILRSARMDWSRRMSVQIAASDQPNAVVLVAPDGTFLTESPIRGHGKLLLDRDNPRHPALGRLGVAVNLHAHADRYLNTEMQPPYVGRKGERR